MSFAPIDISQYSVTLPEQAEPQILRTNLVKWLHDRFSPKRPIIILQASDGAGKTTLLAQFVRHYPDHCFSFFIKPDQYVSSPVRFYQELCSQLTVALTGREVELPYEYYDLQQKFSDLWYQLGKKSKKESEPYFLVIDGLEWTEQTLADDNLVRLLPKAFFPNTYLLASGRPHQNFELEYEREDLQLFSESEVSDYFARAKIPVTSEDIKNIYLCSNGFPGYLDQLRREIERSGRCVSEVLKGIPTGFRQFLDHHWQALHLDQASTLDALALLAFSDAPLNIEDMTTVLQTHKCELESALHSVPLLVPVGNGFRFVTDAHRQFVAEKLASRLSWTQEALIAYYTKNISDGNAVERLPLLLAQTHQLGRLKEVVSVDYILGAIEAKRSMYWARQSCCLVERKAFEHNDWSGVAKYSVLSTLLRSVSSSPVLSSEIDALLKLNDYVESYRLACTAILIEDRLQFFAKICSRMKQQSEPAPEEIITAIDGLIEQIDVHDNNQARLVEISADLFHAHPSGAQRLVQRIVEYDIDGRSADQMLTELASTLEGEAAVHATEVTNNIRDKHLGDFARASSRLVASMSADQVIADIQGINDSAFRILQLRSWCNRNRDNPSAIKVVKVALEELTCAKPNPSVRQLRQFAEPLLASNGEEVLQLVERFDLLKSASIKKPFEELVRLDLILARVEAQNLKGESAEARLFDTYFSVDSIDELDVRCYALVRILSALPTLQPADAKLRTEIESQLDREYEGLLQVSADHHALTHRLLAPLTNYDHSIALRYAKRLNTSIRREAALSRVASVYADRDPVTLDLGLLMGFFSSSDYQLKIPAYRDWALLEVVRNLADNDARRRVPSQSIEHLRQLVDTVAHIHSAEIRAKAYVMAYRMYFQTDAKAGKRYYENMLGALDSVDELWRQIELTFELASLVAETESSLARDMIRKASELRKETPMANEQIAVVYMNTIRLAVRAIPDLVKLKSAEFLTYRQRLVALTRSIPSQTFRIRIYAELAIRLKLAKREADFREIVEAQILPELNTIQGLVKQRQVDIAAWTQMLIEVAPCLFNYERNILAEYIGDLNTKSHDVALGNVIRHLTGNSIIGDPENFEDTTVIVDYPVALQVCELLEQMTYDSYIYNYLGKLIDSLIEEKQSKETCILEDRQALTIAKRLSKIVATRLPDRENIQHEGYRIAAYGSIARLRSSCSRILRSEEQWKQLAPAWEALVAEAEGLQNIADKAIVLIWLGEQMRISVPIKARDVLESARAAIACIPNIIDRSDRLYALARAWHKSSDPESAKVFAKEALMLLQAWEWDTTRDGITGKILELAHSIEPEYASSLTSIIDNPIQRQESEVDLAVRSFWKKPSELLNMQVSDNDRHYVISELSLQLLKSLLSHRGQIQSEAYTAYLQHNIADADYEEAYNVFAWSIENWLARTRDKAGASITPFVDDILDSAKVIQFTGRLLNASEDRNMSGLRRESVQIPTSLKLFAVGEKAEALAALKEWLQNNTNDYVKIYDAFFTESDLDVLAHVPPTTTVIILTSWKSQTGLQVGDVESLRNRYRDYWYRSVSHQVPPKTRLYVYGIRLEGSDASGDSPIHERCYLTAGGRGIRLGTSKSGLGNKDSDIREMNTSEATSIEQQFVDTMIISPPRTYKNQPLISSVIDIE